MTDHEKQFALAQQTRRKVTYARIAEGAKSIKGNHKKEAITAAVILVAAVLWLLRGPIIGKHNPFYVVEVPVLGLLIPIIAILALGGLMYLFGCPRMAWLIEDNLRRAGIVNHAEEPPALLRDIDLDGRKHIYRFAALGIPVSIWLDDATKPKAQTALDAYIIDAVPARGLGYVDVTVVPATQGLPDVVDWQGTYLKPGPILIFGVTLIGDYTIDLHSIPHILIGGTTGSGKTVLLKCLLAQCIAKNYTVVIADLKGGADYGDYYRDHCTLVLDMNSTLEALKAAVTEMTTRQEMLNNARIGDIDRYNAQYETDYHHIIIACDEIAQLLDKTSVSKEVKATMADIEWNLATIARQGRSAGIHLILGTQRPDANVLPGQIKSNIDCRVCGRADKTLSQIIIDSTAAADEIPKTSHGRFIAADGTIFQAYNYN